MRPLLLQSSRRACHPCQTGCGGHRAISLVLCEGADIDLHGIELEGGGRHVDRDKAWDESRAEN